MSSSSTQDAQTTSTGGRRARGSGPQRRRPSVCIEEEIILTHYPAPIASQEEVMHDKATFERCHAHLMAQFGVNKKVPKIGGRAIDLYLLYREVCRNGGCEPVIARKLWVEVCKPHDFPLSFTNKSFVSRKVYCNMLWHFEMIYFHGKAGEPRIRPPFQVKTDGREDGLPPHPLKSKRGGSVGSKKKGKLAVANHSIRKPASARSNSSLRTASQAFASTPPGSPHAHGSPMGSANRQYRQQDMHPGMIPDSSSMGGHPGFGMGHASLPGLHPANSMPHGCGMGAHRLSVSNAGLRAEEEEEQDDDWEEEYSEDQGSDGQDEEEGPRSAFPGPHLLEGESYRCHVVQCLQKHWRVRLEMPGAPDMYAFLTLDAPQAGDVPRETSLCPKELTWGLGHGTRSLRTCRSSSLNGGASRSASPPLPPHAPPHCDRPLLGSQLCRDLDHHLRRDPGFASTLTAPAAEPAMGMDVMPVAEHDEPVVHDEDDMACFARGLNDDLGLDVLGHVGLWGGLGEHDDLTDIPARLTTSLGGDCTADVTAALSPRPAEMPKDKQACPDIDGVVVVFEQQRDTPRPLKAAATTALQPTTQALLHSAASLPGQQQMPAVMPPQQPPKTTVTALQLAPAAMPPAAAAGPAPAMSRPADLQPAGSAALGPATSMEAPDYHYPAPAPQALSPFAIFVVEMHQAVASGACPNQTTDLVQLEQTWDKMTEEEKAPFVKAAHQGMRRMLEENAQWQQQQQQQQHNAAPYQTRVDDFMVSQGPAPPNNDAHKPPAPGVQTAAAFEPGPAPSGPFATLALDNMMTATGSDATTLQLEMSGDLGMLPIQAMPAQGKMGMPSQTLGPAVAFNMVVGAQGGAACKKRGKRTPRSSVQGMLGYNGNQMHHMSDGGAPAQFINLSDNNVPLGAYLGGPSWTARQSVEMTSLQPHFSNQNTDGAVPSHMGGLHSMQGLQHVFDYAGPVGMDAAPTANLGHDRPGMAEPTQAYKQQRTLHMGSMGMHGGHHMGQQRGGAQGWGMPLPGEQRRFMSAGATLHSTSRLSHEDLDDEDHLVVASDLLVGNDLYSRMNLTTH